MKDKSHGVGQSTLRYITERVVFDWSGNSADLHVTPIEEVWNIMKKKSVKLPNNKKKSFGITFVTVWYGIHRETVKKLYAEMHSMVEAVRKAKIGLPCTELLKTVA